MTIPQLYKIYQEYPLVTTDTRNCPKGSIFFALKGERFDGNEYIGQALKNGCSYAVGDSEKLPNDSRIIRVDNVLKALQELANMHRKQFEIPVIAITGTNGKTTTKELVSVALGSKYKVLYTEGNLNNHIGVPLTLLRLHSEHEYAVIEMGANHQGEIHDLCMIAEPDYGLITNVGKAHLEGFGSFEGIVKTKGELYDYLRTNKGTAFINGDNLILKDLFIDLAKVYYGTTPESYVWGQMQESIPFLKLNWHKENDLYELATYLVGAYNLENVLAAICIACYFGVEGAHVNRAIADYMPQNNRSQSKKTDKNLLIIDAYNANPTSMKVALESFFSLRTSPKMVILGEMNELGEYTNEEHQKIVNLLLENRIEKVALCGNAFLACESLPSEWKIFENTSGLLEYLQSENIQGYTILIKGSRGNQLEKTLTFL